MYTQKDNSILNLKVILRRKARKLILAPVVMETHGGIGKLFSVCWSDIRQGVVFEKNPYKSLWLARQRPTWSVYEADCVSTIANGAGRHLPVNVLDVDPYGDPWPVISAFLESDRPHPKNLVIIVTDGLRLRMKLGGAWSMSSLESVVAKFGNDIYKNYLDCCKWLLNQKAEKAGYRLRRFGGFYCGYDKQMTNYLALLEQA